MEYTTNKKTILDKLGNPPRLDLKYDNDKLTWYYLVDNLHEYEVGVMNLTDLRIETWCETAIEFMESLDMIRRID